MKKILLTGAGGFLGRQLLWHLKESDNYFVYAVTSNVEKLSRVVSASNIEIVEINTEVNWNEIETYDNMPYDTFKENNIDLISKEGVNNNQIFGISVL